MSANTPTHPHRKHRKHTVHMHGKVLLLAPQAPFSDFQLSTPDRTQHTPSPLPLAIAGKPWTAPNLRGCPGQSCREQTQQCSQSCAHTDPTAAGTRQHTCTEYCIGGGMKSMRFSLLQFLFSWRGGGGEQHLPFHTHTHTRTHPMSPS